MYIFHFDRDDDAEQWAERWDLSEPAGYTLSEAGERASPIFTEAPGIYISPQVAQERHYTNHGSFSGVSHEVRQIDVSISGVSERYASLPASSRAS